MSTEPTLKDALEKLASDAHRGCGLSYDLFAERFSAAVDRHYPPTSPLREAALELAVGIGYLTPDEIAQAQEDMANDGCCTHGLDPNCCPAGCGDIDDGYWEPPPDRDFDTE
jgi:hypothetical protein